tara:strand:+ start:1639 stop:1788 length:150 start_codon:yes stop_codon:yes gene_type:complete
MKILKLILLIFIPLQVYGQSSEEINKALRDVAEKMNKSLPMNIDKYLYI